MRTPHTTVAVPSSGLAGAPDWSTTPLCLASCLLPSPPILDSNFRSSSPSSVSVSLCGWFQCAGKAENHWQLLNNTVIWVSPQRFCVKSWTVRACAYVCIRMYTTHTHTYMTPRGQKNISLGHAVCVLSHFSRVQLFAAPWTVNHQAFLSMEFSRQEYWNGLPFPPPKLSTLMDNI